MNKLFYLTICVLLFSSCASVSIPLGAYIPNNTETFNCDINVSKFQYLRSDNETVIKSSFNTIRFSRPFAEYFETAIRLELRQSGIKLNRNADIELSADITQFNIDSSSSDVDWIYNVDYKLKNIKSDNVKLITVKTYINTTKFYTMADLTTVIDYLFLKSYLGLIDSKEFAEACK